MRLLSRSKYTYMIQSAICSGILKIVPIEILNKACTVPFPHPTVSTVSSSSSQRNFVYISSTPTLYIRVDVRLFWQVSPLNVAAEVFTSGRLLKMALKFVSFHFLTHQCTSLGGLPTVRLQVRKIVVFSSTTWNPFSGGFGEISISSICSGSTAIQKIYINYERPKK